MTKRAKLTAALIAAVGLVVVTPLTSVAYWTAEAQVAVSAQASTFSLAPVTIAPASAASSTSFTGWSGTQYYAAPLTNDGAAPWAGESVSVAASASGFGPAGAATLQVAFSSASGACQSDTTYTGVTPRSALAASTWTSSAAVASGAAVYACAKLVVTDTDTRTAAGQPAPAPALSLTTAVTASQRNWTDAEQAHLAVSSTGWAACATSGGGVVLTLPAAVQPGNYSVTRNDTGATFSANVTGQSRTSVTLSNPATSGTESADTYVTVKNPQGSVVAVARLGFRSSTLSNNVTKSLVCA